MVGAALVFLLALTVYTLTLAPTVTFVDSGELIVAAKSLGVAHPPGFPLYLLLAHLATLVPVGNVAQRVNFASAFFAALAVAFLYLTVIDSLACSVQANRSTRSADRFGNAKKKRAKPGRKRARLTVEAEEDHSLLTLVTALVAALLLAFSRTFWSFATVAEVYTLNTLLIIVIFFLLFRWRTTGSDGSLYLAAFLFGIALGVHHATVAVTLPAMAVLVYRAAHWNFFKSKRLLWAALISFGGLFLVYSYLPLAASRQPLINWGDPRTMQNLWWHVTGHQYQVFFSSSPSQIANQALEFSKLAAHEFNPAWLPVVFVFLALGLVELFARDRTTFWFLVLVVLADLAYSLNYEIAEDKGAYYLPAFIAAAIIAGFGARFLVRVAIRRASNSPLLPAAASVLVLLLPVITFAGNFPFCNRHNFRLASDYVANIEGPIAPQGMLLTSDWQVYSPLLYLREVELQRRDVVAIDVNMLRRSWYFDYLKTQYPGLINENQNTVEPFLADLRRWEQDPQSFARSPSLTRRINDHFHEMILSFVSTHLRRAPVYVTLEVGTRGEDTELTQALTQKYQLVPQGLVFQLTTDRNFRADDGPNLITHGLADGTFRFADDDVVALKVFPTYVNMLINRGRYLEAYGRHDEAMQSYMRALELDPTSVVAQQALQNVRRMRTGNGQPRANGTELSSNFQRDLLSLIFLTSNVSRITFPFVKFPLFHR